MSLLVAIPVWSGDYEQVMENLRKQFERDGKCKHEAIVCFDQRIADPTPIIDEAGKSFQFVHTLEIGGTPDTPWPRPQNYVWQGIARFLEMKSFQSSKGWFMWESDAMPLKAGWLDVLAAEYSKGRKPFMGHIVPGRGHMNAVAVYPFNVSTYCTNAFLVKTSPFDVMLTKEVGVKNITPANHLIAHHLKTHGGDPAKPITKAVLESLPKTTVIVHGYIDCDIQEESEVKDKSEPEYSISILCFNNLELTRRCVESVLKHSDYFEVIVTDNASIDGTKEYLKTLKDDRIRIIRNAHNRGFNQPNNHAASIARGKYFVMLNNDAEVGHGWLGSMRKALTKHVGIVGMTKTCSELSEQCTGRPGKLEYVEASCCMMRTEIARTFGPFSSYLKFAYHEDSDLSLRLREAGYEIKAIDLPVKHIRATTSSKVEGITKIAESNRKEMVKRWGFYLKSRTFDRKVLIRRRGAQGDILFLTPVIREMRKKWPKAIIEVDTDYPEILNGHRVNAVRGIDEAGFDTFFDLDLAYEKTPKKHVVDAYFEACELGSSSRQLEFRGSSLADIKWVRNHIGQKPLAVMHAGPTGWMGRDWPLPRFEDLAKRLRFHGWDVATIGSEGNNLIAKTFDFRGTTLGQLYALISECSLFVGIDSLPFNLAQAAGIRAVGLFGTINPAYRICSDKAIAVHATKQQAKCLFAHHDLPPPVTKSECSGECMRALTVQAVLEAIGA